MLSNMVDSNDKNSHGESLALVVWGRRLQSASWIMAIVGGAVLLGIVLLIVVSIVNRKLFSFPVPGDVELTSMAAAVAVACFFPWCHMNAGDVKVDFFTNKWNPRVVWGLEAVGSLLVALFAAAVAWRTVVAAISVHDANEISAILGVQAWYSYAGMVPGFVLLAIVATYRCIVHIRAAGANLAPDVSTMPAHAEVL